jgi:spore germination protein GerM
MRRIVIWVVLLAAAAAAVWWFAIRPQEATVEVFFVGPTAGGTSLASAQRTVIGRGGEEKLKGAFEALLAGPTAEERARGFVTEIPAGTRLRGLSLRDGITTVDLSGDLAAGGGSTSMQARVWQIVYTGTQLGARQVRILVDGAERQALGGEGIIIDRPLARPPAFPSF